MNKIFLLTGSNIEPQHSFLRRAKIEIGKRVGHILKSSEIYKSAPWGFEAKTSFLNQVLLVHSGFEAEEVLDIILEIEKEMGRERFGTTYTSRNIDIDILYFGDEVYENEILQVPHPRLHLRRFTLIPLVEIAPKYIHPKCGMSNKKLLEECPDHSIVNKFKEGIVEV